MSRFSLVRILVPLCGALLVTRAPVALAQDDEMVPETAATSAYPAPAKTPEEAGERFYQFLGAGSVVGNPSSGVAFNWPRADAYVNSLSRAQMLEVSVRPSQVKLEALLALLVQQKDEPQFEGKVVGKDGEATLVEVAPAPAKKRAVVVIPEDGGFRVDVKATFGRWNDLSGEKLDIAWADYTGIITPELAKNTEYIAKRQRDSCQSNLKQLMLGVLQYSQDYNEKFPTTNKWMDAIFPYVRTEEIMHCPAVAEQGAKAYGYALNQNLSGMGLSRMGAPAQTVAIYESEDLIRNAFGTGEERAYRHSGGSNIAFADGHIKWFAQGEEKPEEVRFQP